MLFRSAYKNYLLKNININNFNTLKITKKELQDLKIYLVFHSSIIYYKKLSFIALNIKKALSDRNRLLKLIFCIFKHIRVSKCIGTNSHKYSTPNNSSISLILNRITQLNFFISDNLNFYNLFKKKLHLSIKSLSRLKKIQYTPTQLNTKKHNVITNEVLNEVLKINRLSAYSSILEKKSILMGDLYTNINESKISIVLSRDRKSVV